MSGLNVRTVMELLNGLHADAIGTDYVYPAEGRRAVLRALASVAGGLAEAVTVLDEKMAPPRSPRRRNPADARWRKVSGHLAAVVIMAGDLDQQLQIAAGRAERLIAAFEPVFYDGSLRAQHGLCALTGTCNCDDCDYDGRNTVRLRTQSDAELSCVGTSSVKPINVPPDPGITGALRVERVLAFSLAGLPSPLDAGHTLTLTRALSTITGRARLVLCSWRQPIEHHLGGQLYDLTGFVKTHNRKHAGTITHALEQGELTLTAMQARFRRAAAGLAEIEDDPAGIRAA